MVQPLRVIKDLCLFVAKVRTLAKSRVPMTISSAILAVDRDRGTFHFVRV